MSSHNISYYDRINLNPGELYIGEEPTVVWTVLGSCLAIILHHASSKLGAISHAQIPEERLRDRRCSDFCPHPCYMEAPETNRFKYVSCSFKYMHDFFVQHNIPAHEIEVKLFGGANMFPLRHTGKSVGEENIDIARKVINASGLRIASENVGGTLGRTLYFHSDTGEVWLKINKPRPLNPGHATVSPFRSSIAHKRLTNEGETQPS